MHNFRKLHVWQRATIFAREVYRMTAAVRPEQKVVTAQLRRSALSIGAMIAEGCGKRTRGETIRFLDMACGSAAESQHHLLQASDLGIIREGECASMADEAIALQRMLRGLIKRLPAES